MTTFLVFFHTVVLALAVPSLVLAQATSPAPPAEPSLRTFFPDLLSDVRRLPSNPVAVRVTLGGIASSGLSTFDDNFATWNKAAVFESGTWIGNGYVLAAGTLTVYSFGQPRVKRIAADMLRAQVLSLGLAYGLKYTVRRERPDHSGQDSFPSGHATQTFATAAVLARHVGIWAWPVFAGAGFVAASRVNQRRHFVSDVAFGAGMGLAVGWNGARVAPGWTVAPAVSPSSASIQISRTFTP